jgi:hypothetical protein
MVDSETIKDRIAEKLNNYIYVSERHGRAHTQYTKTCVSEFSVVE